MLIYIVKKCITLTHETGDSLPASNYMHPKLWKYNTGWAKKDKISFLIKSIYEISRFFLRNFDNSVL